MAKKPKVSAKETAFAESFLKYAGVKDPRANVYLILAVIAWMRQESGGLSRVIGNNPFNIRSSPFAIGYRQTRNGNGRFAIFKNLDAGARAAVALLKSDGKDGWRGYGLILRAAVRSAGNKEADKQGQAIDFLNAIALSKWDAAHYGTQHKVTSYTIVNGKKRPGSTKKVWYTGNAFTQHNHLVQVWAALTGATINFPAPKVKQEPPPQPPKPKPVQLEGRLYAFPIPEYIQPYEAFGWYEARRWVPAGPPGDPVVG